MTARKAPATKDETPEASTDEPTAEATAEATADDGDASTVADGEGQGDTDAEENSTEQTAEPAPRVPQVGDHVLYCVTDEDATHVNDLRARAHRSLGFHRENGSHQHEGNTVVPGDVFPMDIVRVFDDPATPDSLVNGQVHLDGNDTLWVTSRGQGEGHGGHWTWRDRG